MVQAIPQGMPTMAAAKERKHRPALPIGPMSGNRQCVDSSISTAVGAFGRDLRKRLEHQINQAQNGFSIATNWAGSRNRQEGLIVNNELYGFQNTCVSGNFTKYML